MGGKAYNIMNADVLRIQKELIARGYLAAGEDDGVFGLITLDAVNHYRATLGKPPLGPSIKRIDIAELLLTLFPAEYAKPVSHSPADPNWLVRVGINLFLSQLLKGLPVMNVLTGYKTYIAAGLMLLVGVVQLLGVSVPAFGTTDPGTLISGALALIFLRNGINTAAK